MTTTATGGSGSILPRRFLRAVPATLLAVLLMPPSVARAQETSSFLEKLLPSPAAGARQFGLAVGGDRSRLLVGGVDRVQAWRWDAGALTAEGSLVPGSVAPGNRYGYALGVSGDLAVVGAPMDDAAGTSSGSVVVFRHDGAGWQETDQLTAPDGRSYDQFGTAVAVWGSRILVGSPFRDVGGANRGAAYVFVHDGVQWSLEATLMAGDGLAGAAFGSVVGLRDDLAVVGVANDDEAGINAGATYVFRLDGASWGEEQKLMAPDAADQDRFGSALAVGEGCLLVGAPNQDAMGADAGAVYVYRYAGGAWSLEQELTAADGAAGHRFGGSVQWLRPGQVAVGAEAHDAMGRASGATYRYAAGAEGWAVAETLRGPDTAPGDRFGHAVGGGPGFLVVGSHLADEAGTDAGAAYVFELPQAQPDAQPQGLTLAVAGSDRGQGRHVLTFQVTGGEPGARVVLVIVEHRGLPMFRVVGFGRLDEEGGLSRRVRLPWRHRRSLDLVFQCFQGARCRDRVPSNQVEIRLEGLHAPKGSER